jgi:hypothetical protein
LTRGFFLILGCIAALWGAFCFQKFWQEASTEQIAKRIVAGEIFKPEILARQLPIINNIESSTFCRPAALRSAAIIELRMMELAAPSNGSSAGRLMSLRDLIRHSLSCAPADTFLWFVLYLLEDAEGKSKLEYLRMSYYLGPNEGWIGIKRNPITFGLPDPLPNDLAKYATIEFSGLVNMGAYEQAADIITGPAWRLRARLLSSLQNVDESRRRAFTGVLYSRLISGRAR